MDWGWPRLQKTAGHMRERQEVYTTPRDKNLALELSDAVIILATELAKW